MNCWEFKKCGREKNGNKVEKLGVCPAHPNNGRCCARVAGTLCGVKVQGAFALKFKDCIKCDFYNSPYYKRIWIPSLEEWYPIVLEEIEVRKGIILQKRGCESLSYYPLILAAEDSLYSLGHTLNFNDKLHDYVAKVQHIIDAW